ncbi:MAG: histidine--tRNA ligase [Lachnospiraceae bacterium]|nr:histidine--tRNA ligase [Lachnospiraceae bacterium]
MAMKKKPVTGMKDILPKEMAIRDYCIGLIKETYKTFGFTSVETPCVEHIENLSSNQGGENEKLIFKILKRGDKLSSAVSTLLKEGANSKEETADDSNEKLEADAGILVDGGLRYDLTLPLSRYYSNNANDLPSPFKALQMGNVWRADRPQRGRYRQFMQCDIDILGESSILAEIELILATTTLLGRLDFKNFTIRINDRRILKAMAAYSGFPESDYDTVFIILDKMDKIGLEGVKEELLGCGYSSEAVDKYLNLFDKATGDIEGVRFIRDELGDFLDTEVSDNLETIITSVENAKAADFKMQFDPTLVRGMSYYTGPIFEISMDEYGGSVGGGGRYDEMIGKFIGTPTPACGFSIGFERIIMLLLENDFKVPGEGEKKAYLVEKGMPSDKLLKILEKAREERAGGKSVNVVVMKKNKKFQKDQMAEEGYTEFVEFFKDKEI